MFGCAKPEASSPDPTPDADVISQDLDTAPTTSVGPTMHATREDSNNGQLLTVDRQLSLSEGERLAPNGEPSSTRPWTMSVPALRSDISFANALPPIPTGIATKRQQQQQQPASTDDVFKPFPELHKSPQPQGKMTAAAVDHVGGTAPAVDASVSGWLSQQVAAELQPTICGGGNSMLEAATAGAEQGEASRSSGTTNAEAVGMQVRSVLLSVTGSLMDSGFSESLSRDEMCDMPVSYRLQ